MWRNVKNALRLLRAAYVLAQYEALFPLELLRERPFGLRALIGIAKFTAKTAAVFSPKKLHPASEDVLRLSQALAALGPAYIKLGQFLATRPDIIGASLADDLKLLQDRLPPFGLGEARRLLASELGEKSVPLLAALKAPIAAASIAQVHAVELVSPDGSSRKLAVKILRPDVEMHIARDLESFFWVAQWLENHLPMSRRLRPMAAVQTLAESLAMETDLRLEAAAMTEMQLAARQDADFSVPDIAWDMTAQRVLTSSFVDGISVSDRAALVSAGHDMPTLATKLIQIFLTHALRDGFFHADMHPGNLFVDGQGRFVAVDFGIMGRLDGTTRRFLAEVLMGFIRRDYHHVARIHFSAGFVPAEKSVGAFAQALRAIGEPIMGRPADEISMARLLGQLFQVTAQFSMPLQPQLLLLQKTMVVVEGVARHLDPHNNIWLSAEPVLRRFMQEKLGPEGRLAEAAEGAMAFGRAVSGLPALLERAEQGTRALHEMLAEGGLKLHPATTEMLAKDNAKRLRHTRLALWLAAMALILVLYQLFFG